MDNSTYHRCAFCDKVIGLNDDVWTNKDVLMFCSKLHARKFSGIKFEGTLKKYLYPDDDEPERVVKLYEGDEKLDQNALIEQLECFTSCGKRLYSYKVYVEGIDSKFWITLSTVSFINDKPHIEISSYFKKMRWCNMLSDRIDALIKDGTIHP